VAVSTWQPETTPQMIEERRKFGMQTAGKISHLQISPPLHPTEPLQMHV